MATFNKVILLGNLTRDPELRYTPQGSAVCEFALALNYQYTNKQTGQKVEEVSFIEIVAWGKTGEICAEYLKKGRQVMIAMIAARSTPSSARTTGAASAATRRRSWTTRSCRCSSSSARARASSIRGSARATAPFISAAPSSP